MLVSDRIRAEQIFEGRQLDMDNEENDVIDPANTIQRYAELQ